MSYNKNVSIANKTDRSKGAVGKNALVPRFIKDNYSSKLRVLDYGSGKNCIHAKYLAGIGYSKIDAYEFGNNVTVFHITNPRNGYYDLIYASNVLNVQVDYNMLKSTIQHISELLYEKGTFVFNYPKSPRKGVMESINEKTLLNYITTYGFSIETERYKSGKIHTATKL